MTLDVKRKEFEQWLQGTSGWKACKQRGKPMSLRQHMGGSYADYRVNDRWLAWCAAVRECIVKPPREGRRVWVVVDCPPWPDGLHFGNRDSALNCVREHGTDETSLSTWVEKARRVDYTPEQTRAMLGDEE